MVGRRHIDEQDTGLGCLQFHETKTVCILRLIRHRQVAAWFVGLDGPDPDVFVGGSASTTKAWSSDGRFATGVGLPISPGDSWTSVKSALVASTEVLVGWLAAQGLDVAELEERFVCRRVSCEELWDLYPPSECIVDVGGAELTGYHWDLPQWDVKATVCWGHALIAVMRKAGSTPDAS